jgi:hypothetical protein
MSITRLVGQVVGKISKGRLKSKRIIKIRQGEHQVSVTYPKPNEKTRVGDLAKAVGSVKEIAQECQRVAAKAAQAFETESEKLSSKNAKNVEALAKASLRAAGKPILGSTLDGPDWARFDALAGYSLGIASEASAQSLVLQESRAAWVACEARLAAAQKQWDASKPERVAARQFGLEAKKSFDDASASFLPHQKAYQDFFKDVGCQANEEAEAHFAPANWLGRLLGSKKDALRARWIQARDSGVDFVGLHDKRKQAQATWDGAMEVLSGFDRAESEKKKVEEQLEKARIAVAKPSQWLDKGAYVVPTSIYKRIESDPSRLEPLLVAVSNLMPSARAEARAALRVGLSGAALSMSAASLGRERDELSKMMANLAEIESKMRRASSGNKGSVKFDMGDLARKLTERARALGALAKKGPSMAIAKMDAMDWSVDSATQLSKAEIKTMQKAAVAQFGKDSAPAKALAKVEKSHSGGDVVVAGSSSGSDMSAVFWYSMLSNSSSSHAGSNSLGFDTGASSAASFDFGSVGVSIDSSGSTSWDSGSSSSGSYSSCSSSSSSCSSSSSSCSSSSSSCSSSSSSCSSGSSCSS